MFDKAFRQKLRFESSMGQLSVEDLWDLPLTAHSGKANLDDIAKELHHQLKNGDDISFVIQSKKSDETIQLKFDIVKHIIDVRLAEQSAAETLRSNKEKKQQLLAIIAQKENEGLMNTSLDELKKMAESL
jgi:hypothetical protein